MINPSKHYSMHSSNLSPWWVSSENRRCWNLGSPKWIISWQENPISSEIKQFIPVILQWRLLYMVLEMVLQQNEANLRCAWIVCSKWRPNVQILLNSRYKSDRRVIFIRWQLLNTSILINLLNIISNNYCRRSGLSQLLPEAYCPRNLHISTQLQKKRFTRWQTCPPTDMWNVWSDYPMLRLSPPPAE